MLYDNLKYNIKKKNYLKSLNIFHILVVTLGNLYWCVGWTAVPVNDISFIH